MLSQSSKAPLPMVLTPEGTVTLVSMPSYLYNVSSLTDKVPLSALDDIQELHEKELLEKALQKELKEKEKTA